VATLRHPPTNTIHNTSYDVIDIATTHYMKEQQRSTPNHLPQAPWTQPQNPDNFEVTPPTQDTTPHPIPTLDTCITRGYYDRTTTRVLEGKAPVPDAITNKLIKHLPEASHTQDTTTRQRSGAETPRTCLLYRPNKKDPHIIAYY